MPNDQKKIAAIVPFFNEELFIKKLFLSLSEYVHIIIAINDGSTDSSEDIVESFSNVILLKNRDNIGKGYSLNLGFIKAADMGFDYVITIDADLQHDPKFIPEFLKELDKFDVIIGNRLSNISKMPFQRILSNKITSYLLSIKTGQKIKDSQCGFRAYKTEILKDIIPQSLGFEAESEIIINAARKKYRIGFVPISTLYGNEKSKLNPLQAIYGFIKIIFK